MSTARQIRVNAFDMNCADPPGGGDLAGGRQPQPRAVQGPGLLDRPGAELLERGRFDGIFIADVLGVYDVYGGSPDAALRARRQVPVNDPLLVVSAMAARDRAPRLRDHRLDLVRAPVYVRPPDVDPRPPDQGRGSAGTSSPPTWRRRAGTSASRGTISTTTTATRSPTSTWRSLYKLWEGSWEDDAVVADVERDVYTDPATRLIPIGHEGTVLSRWPGSTCLRALAAAHAAAATRRAQSNARARRSPPSTPRRSSSGAPRAEIMRGNIDEDLRSSAGRRRPDADGHQGVQQLLGDRRADAGRRPLRSATLPRPDRPGGDAWSSGRDGSDTTSRRTTSTSRWVHVPNEAMQSTR